MKKISLILMLMLATMLGHAQTARQVLDRTAAIINNKGGASASFKIAGGKINSTGTIAIKGRKFHAATPQAIVWFDGKTQWTYMKQNEEVNVSTPTESELQAINPYNFIYLYKKGFQYTLTTKGNNHEVHLTATDKTRKTQEMYITVNKTTYVPVQIRMRQGKDWTTININNFKKQTIADSQFQFNRKDYPKAEIIDLR